MTEASVATLGRRLERLRSAATPSAVPTGRTLSTVDHASSLADTLGGQVVRSHRNAIVVLETSVDVPMSTSRLASLPYAIADGYPLVCLDLETTGLATAAGTLAFLVGLGMWRGGRFGVTQLLLPDHACERALLDVLGEILPRDSWLVTYNGRCFDWPLLTARYRLHRRDAPAHAGHLDLLPVARQLWKHRLEGARLAVVERVLCGVDRPDDLPGHLIPERYFSYLRLRRGQLLRQVVDHNRQDIVSLALLVGVLGDKVATRERWPLAHPGDLYGLARAYARRHRPNDALQAVEAALCVDAWSRGIEGGAQLHRRLSAERARLLARLGRREEAHAAWLEITASGGPGAGIAWLHVARYREHVQRDILGALEACREATSVAERAHAWGNPLAVVERDLARRLPRLRRLAFRRRPFSRGVRHAA